MNKNLHRTIFNAARGMRMVVQETARSAGKSTTTASGLGVALSALLGAASAQAQIIGAPNVPGNQRPMVIAAPNGVPLVNIQTPSAAGVSRNVYSRFDIEQRGAILNNSRTNAQTQLGGWVQGNPFLATGPARVILNEINSGNPSQIRGYIEVAGQRAEVIVANPAGIYVDGAGFINASRATLTTGVPQLNAFGGLDGYRVSGGTISIDGKGLDLSGTDYAAIYARALQVNAGIWAKDLKVVVGANEVGVNDTAITPIAGTGAAPTFALDVAALGGMYANKITLIGTEAGLGVRNAGNIGAGAGGLVVTAAGRLENIGTLEGARVELASAGDIDNRGGTIRQSSAAGLTLTAPSLSNTQGGTIGAEPLNTGSSGESGSAGGTTGGSTPEGGSAGSGSTGGGASSGSGSTSTSGGTAPTTIEPPPPGSITASGAILNDGGRIFASGPITLHTPQINNAGGSLSAASMAVTGPAFSNAGGTLNISDRFQANVDQFDNTGGVLQAGNLDIATTGDLLNQGGTLASNGNVNLAIGGDANNQRGSITAIGALSATVGGTLDNSSKGRIADNGQNLQLQSSVLINAGGQIEHAGSGTMSIHAASYSGADGNITSNGTLAITVAGDFNQDGGSTYAQQISLDAGALSNRGGKLIQSGLDDLRVAVRGAIDNSALDDNKGGTIASNGGSILTASSLKNSGGGSIAAVNGDLHLTTSSATLNAGGTLQAGGATFLSNAGLDNSSGKVFGDSLSVDTHGQQLTNTGGTLASTGTVDIQSGTLTNDAGLIQSGGAMAIDTHGQALVNTNAARYANGAGGITSGDTLNLNAGDVDNSAGFLGAANQLIASTRQFTNADGGLVLGRGSVNIDTRGAAYDNTAGQIQAVGDLALRAGSIQNTGGLLRSGAALTLDAGTIVNANTQGTDQGIEGQDVAIHATSLGNTWGVIRANNDITVTSGGTVDNSGGGLMSAGNALSIVDAQAADPAAKTLNLINTAGTLIASERVNIDAARFSGDGQLASGNDLSLALTQDLVNNAEIIVNGNLSYGTTGNLTNHGKLLAGQTLTVSGNAVQNTADAEMSGNHTVVNAATLNNRGLIDSAGTTRINGDTINNLGTGRIYGNTISVGASTLNNDMEVVNGMASSGTIAARGDLHIAADVINNREHALIFSGENMTIGGALDLKGKAIGQGGTLNNLSADIESLSEMSISMAQINNHDIHIQKGPQQTYEVGPVTTIALIGGAVYSLDQVVIIPGSPIVWARNPDGTAGAVLGINGYGIWNTTSKITEDTATNADPSRIVSGGDMTLEGHVHNLSSKIIAGGTLVASDVDNEGFKGTRLTKTEAIVFDHTGQRQPNAAGTPQLTTIELDKYEPVQHLNATSGQRPDSATVGATGATGGGAAGVSGGMHPGAVVEVPASVGSSEGSLVIRTRSPDFGVPSASLFRTVSGNRYLIETDPRFANYRSWLSSDYLLNAMGFDANSVQKRLGDGFYEQKLIREQIGQLTGYRYLEDFGNDEEQYAALMNAGVTFAQKYQLTPGIALTAAQMAQLTSDIVWLVEQTVALPDGSTQSVLVPQVYVRVKPGDIDGSGALLSAESIMIKGSGDLANTGTIAGRSLVSISADNVNNLLGGRIDGGVVGINAKNDINNIGASITADEAAVLTAGRDINVRSTTQTTTDGTHGGSNLDQIAGVYVSNPNGTLIASAGRDVNLIAAAMISDGTAAVGAGRNINLGTVTEASAASAIGSNGVGISTQSREIGSVIVANGNVSLAAGNDLNIRAGAVASTGGALVATARNDINLSAGQATSSVATATTQTSGGLFKKTTASTFDSSSTTDVLSSSLSGNTVALVAGNDINAQAAQLRSDAAMSLSAGRDINLTTANQTNEELHASQTRTRATALGNQIGLSMGPDTPNGAAMRGSKSGTQVGASTTTQAVGTTISAGNLQVVSGRDTTLQAATVVADNNITMVAGRNLTIESAQNTSVQSGSQSNGKTGMVGTWYNPAIGNVKSFEATAQSGTTQVSSQVASLQGDVTLVAGGAYRQTASSVMALGQAGSLVGGDVNILAKNVLINEAHNTGQSVGVGRTSSTIMGGSANVGGISTDSVRNAGNTLKAMDDTGDSRMQALGAANLAMSGKQAYDTAQALAGGGQLSYGVSVNVSRNTSQSTQFANSSQAVGSGIVAANNVNIVATGGGQDSNIHAIGSTIAAGKTVNLAADNNITLEASKSTFDSAGRNSSSGANVGVTFGAGAQNGFSIQLGVSQGQGRNNQNDVTYTNTRVSGGNAVNITSGGDLNIRGGVVEANRVTADVGGNLNIESLQDVSVGSSKQSSSGLNVSLCIPPICYGAVVTASGNAASAKADGVFVSPNEQSGIKAGDGGFDVNVKGNTDLKGAVIESTQAAIDNNKNNFHTGGALTMSDLQNVSQSSGSSYSVSGGVSLGYTTQADANPSLNPKAGQKAVPPSGGAGVGSDEGGNQASTTKSGISGIAGDQSVRTGDNSSAGTLIKDWNTETIVKDVQAQAQITQQFSQNAAREIGTYADKQRDAALARGDKEEAAKWDEGGEYRVAAHTAAGALSGGVSVALAAGASAALMPKLGEAIADMDLPAPVAQALGAATAAAIGGVVGGAAGAGSAYSIDINNRQLHPTEAKIIKDNAARFAKQLYGTDNPTFEQIEAAGSMLATTAQSQLDNNLGYTVLYSEDANNFLQALKIEYMQQNGTLVLPDTQGTQQLFYATVAQKNNPSLNQGSVDSSITGLIVRTPLAPSYNNPTNDPTRDKLTGLPLDEQGRYAVQITVDGKTYEPKYFPCATADCVAAKKNYDTSDPATQAYLRAVDKMVLDDINKGATLVTLASPTGVAGALAAFVGPLTSLGSGVLADQAYAAAAKESIQYVATQYLSRVYGLGDAAANRIAAAIDMTGGWQSFIDRVKSESEKR